MKLTDLNKITIEDLKNIDWYRVKVHIQSRPNIAINILMAVITLVFVSSTYQKYTNSKTILNAETATLRKKLESLDTFKITQTKYDNFLNNFPELIGKDRLIETLSKFAIKRNVQILSSSPIEEKSNMLIRILSVEINVASENFSDIILFVRDIESSQYPIRIGKWSGTSKTPSSVSRQRFQRSTQQDAKETVKKEFIEAKIKIESVRLKNEK